MAIAAAAVIVPLGVLFFLSGLVVNFIQAVCFVLLRPLSKNTYRRVNEVVAELLWLELVWLIDWWAGVKIQLYTDSETFKLMGKEHALLIPNHRSDIDWLVGWVLAQRSGCLGSSLAVMKNSSKLLPVIGWSMWFSEYLFLERSWAKDESTLKLGFQRLRDFPLPFWLALFVEGTRFTQAKLLAAQEYATSTGMPVPRNVLIPRTKGFVTAVSHMRSFVPAIYDVTVAIPKTLPAPTMLRLFKGQSSMVHVHIKRHLMKDLPETDDAVAQWCRDVFVAKDKLLDKHIADNSFDEQLQDTDRPLKSLLVVISWASLLIFGAYKFFQTSSLLSSWKGLTFSAIGLAIVTFLMQILIQFSQSEQSTPAKVVPSNPKNGGEYSVTQQDKQCEKRGRGDSARFRHINFCFVLDAMEYYPIFCAKHASKLSTTGAEGEDVEMTLSDAQGWWVLQSCFL
ncbi:1-acyl-sn-glycerol-3-phosphate acyltransferase 2 [Abeliophyllum distichum]|uniref:1-acylglycerol-3-phosphate O-acyltransferase n=1 Tax=Abeliophyllum distichum TaxID=126358 RepID=A0ABD1PQF5_9LAMI